ncbi:uncharacterized protein LOC116291603 [Actinia tenebrosa]|uniref:Uncharacterized protein LOC116291603 n=1 Tax=Actinia tenebrosa TaxID=6105 RepID=A0A6P8HDZ6_ACTTE|nr:uncharacterized protein LOC116291603 [Actinia tenebrosa]
MSVLNVVIFCVLVAWNYADAHVQESITLRVFDRSFNPGDVSVYQRLLDANLEGRGFNREIVTKTVTEKDNSTMHQVVFLFHKTVACRRAGEVERKINEYVEGLLSGELADRLAIELEKRKINQLPTCKVGIEVHFRVDPRTLFRGRRARRGVDQPRERKQDNHVCIGVCIHIVAEK